MREIRKGMKDVKAIRKGRKEGRKDMGSSKTSSSSLSLSQAICQTETRVDIAESAGKEMQKKLATFAKKKSGKL